MLAVWIYIVLIVLSVGIGISKLEANNWKPWYTDSPSPVSSHLITAVILVAFYLWIISTVGWIPATMVLAGTWIYGFIGGLVEIAKFGATRVTLTETILFLPVYAFIIIGLLQALAVLY